MNIERSQEIIQVHCNSCGQLTDHIVLHEEKRESSQQVAPYISVEEYDWYRLITCAGCKAVSMEHVSANSEDWEPDTGPNYSKEYFPPRTFRRVPDWVAEDSIPQHIGRLLGEIYIALQNRTNSLAGLGIRALLESVMIEQVGDNGAFAANLKALLSSR